MTPYLVIGLFSMVGPFFWPLNNEVVLAAGLASKSVRWLPAAPVIAAGSTASFLLWYLLGRTLLDRVPSWQEKVEKIPRERFLRWTELLTFTGGLTAIPPVTAVALLSGSLRLSVWQFALITFAGRTVRFLILGWFEKTLLHNIDSSHYSDFIQRWF